jgi:N-acetylglucosamine malate deacetylase 1
MSKMKTLVIAPHPDDEVLGAGGTLLRRQNEGGSIAWLIVTSIPSDKEWPDEKIIERQKEIEDIAKFFKFDEVFNLSLPTSELDTIPYHTIVKKISHIISSYKPDEVLVPHYGDVHTDHQIVFNASVSSSKSFRHPFIKRILCYEVLSETNFSINPVNKFIPNYFVNISDFLEKKIEAMEIYKSEMLNFPFPRSRISIESQARLNGSASGFKASEAFQLLLQRS